MNLIIFLKTVNGILPMQRNVDMEFYVSGRVKTYWNFMFGLLAIRQNKSKIF